MGCKIIDEYTDRVDLSYKQKYCLRYPERILEQKKKDSIRRKNHRDKENNRVREWRLNNPEKVTIQNRKYVLKEYSISQEDYDLLVFKQKDKCAICGGSDKRHNRNNWCIDHCHKENYVRGLLCVQCNVLLGNANDDVEILKKAIKYLELTKEQVAQYESGKASDNVFEENWN